MEEQDADGERGVEFRFGCIDYGGVLVGSFDHDAHSGFGVVEVPDVERWLSLVWVTFLSGSNIPTSMFFLFCIIFGRMHWERLCIGTCIYRLSKNKIPKSSQTPPFPDGKSQALRDMLHFLLRKASALYPL